MTVASARWVIRNRAWSPWYLIRYWRFLVFKVRNPHIITTGFVFLGKHVEVNARKGYGRMILGRWVHLGDGNRVRCHEGSLVIGDKCVFGRENTVNAYLDIEIGAGSIISDWVYVCDFDHVTEDIYRPIKDQGIVKSPVRIGPDVWIGTKATVLRGTTIGNGSVLGAHSLVRGEVPPFSVMGGVPARVLKDRREIYAQQEVRRIALQDIAQKTQRAVEELSPQSKN